MGQSRRQRGERVRAGQPMKGFSNLSRLDIITGLGLSEGCVP